MAVSKGDVLAHFKYLQKAIDETGAEAILSLANFSVFIRRDAQDKILYPQFLTVVNGAKQYSQTFGMNARQFIGWLPYYNKRWKLASNKLAFKNYALANGIRIPEFSIDRDARMHDVLVKRDMSSFGSEIRGPFKHSGKIALDPGQGEYYERFIEGKIVKAWYWNAIPVCMELDTMPFLIGDGTSTIGELLRRRLKGQKGVQANPEKSSRLEETIFRNAGQVLSFFGLGLDSVLMHRQRQLVEFRYASDVALPSYRQVIDLRTRMPPALEAELLKIGKTLWAGIPFSQRENTIFTVDAIVDAENRLWALEMNSNPYVHPLAYPLIVPALFASEASARPAAAMH